MTIRHVMADPLVAWEDDAVWHRKLESDADQIERCLPHEVRALHGAVVFDDGAVRCALRLLAERQPGELGWTRVLG